ncbi:16S rRNA (guanine(527)-N(7))-methyltransferase RsmG [Oceaniglobus ichthyenteri]|uniref:16S rRNA (guanine(527)-N(7))-methyltransferase RsmG n=1 Tax=Oceaniglobus ichthyenteri TaxID=2136177 RepID=UPI001F0CBDCE|nr:16S rRNA (guanine(527)-N(7))-methyltransferase RsmG [Oceaniglobus ichthyenteri]
MVISFEELQSQVPYVSRETYSDLCAFEDTIRKWNRQINLVSSNTLDEIWTRHFIDSLQLLPHIPGEARQVLDIGSGGGFPGIPLALAMKQHGAEFSFVESDQRKCEFLRTVSRVTNIHPKIINQRIENLEPQSVDVLTARALAPLGDLLGFAHRHLAPTGIALFLKGARLEDEMKEAQNVWQFSATTHSSITAPDATILCIGDIRRV